MKYLDLENEYKIDGNLEIVIHMIKLMLNTSKIEVVYDFLYDVGFDIANKYPIYAKRSLSDLQLQINDRLSVLGFGVAQIEDNQDSLCVIHRQVPMIKDKSMDNKWLHCISVVLCGLYNGYFKQSGAPSALFLSVDKLNAPDEIVFSLKKRS